MLDLGWTELLLIGIVALIVVGPKDLPGMFQAVGKFVGKAKGMAREFSRAMNDAADQSGRERHPEKLQGGVQPDEIGDGRGAQDHRGCDPRREGRRKAAAERKAQAQADKIREKSGEMAAKRKAAEAETQAAQSDAESTPEAGKQAGEHGPEGQTPEKAESCKAKASAKPRQGDKAEDKA